jgi:hypothetical protein
VNIKGVLVFVVGVYWLNATGAELHVENAVSWPSISAPEAQIAFAGHPTEIYLAVSALKAGQTVRVQLHGDVAPVLFSNFVVSQNLWDCQKSQRSTVCGQGRDVFITSLTCTLEHAVSKNERVILPVRLIFPDSAVGTWQDLAIAKKYVEIDVLKHEREMEPNCYVDSDDGYVCSF